nr:hypothetical protein [Clostridioides sp.]
MATNLSKIFEHFLSQINDEEMLLISDEILEDQMIMYLEKAIFDFPELKKDTTIVKPNEENSNEGYIIGDLDNDEIIILSYGMVLWWLQPKINREENLKQQLTDHDYKALSGANMLLRLQAKDRQTRDILTKYRTRYEYKGFKGWD